MAMPMTNNPLVFTTEERVGAYLDSFDENQAFMDIRERAPENVGSEDLNTGFYIEETVRELLPKLQAFGVGHVWVDLFEQGGYNRVYPLPFA
jgi:hypothetical protein